MSDATVSLYPERKPAGRRSVWPMRLFFLTLHSCLITVGLTWAGVVQVPPQVFRAFPSLSRFLNPPAPPIPPTVAKPSLPSPAPIVTPPPTPRPIQVATPPHAGGPDKLAGPNKAPKEAPPGGKSLAKDRGVALAVPPQSPEQVFASNGLTAARGVLILLAGEDESAEKLARIHFKRDQQRPLKSQIEATMAIQDRINDLEEARPFASNAVARARNDVDRLPYPPITNFDRDARDMANLALINAKDVLQGINEEIVMRRSQIDRAGWKRLLEEWGERKSSLAEDVRALRERANAITAVYERLEQQPEIREALGNLRASGRPMKLGPSDRFRETIQGLARVEKELGEGRAR